MINTDDLVTTVAISLATASIAITISKAKMFLKIRNAIDLNGPAWLNGVIHCPYCLSHWVALFWMLLYYPRPVSFLWGVDFFLAWFAIIALATIWVSIICKALLRMEKLSVKGGST